VPIIDRIHEEEDKESFIYYKQHEED